MVVPLLIYTGAFSLVLLLPVGSNTKGCPPVETRRRVEGVVEGLAPYVCTLYCSLTIVCACWAARGSILMPNRGLGLVCLYASPSPRRGRGAVQHSL